MSKKQIPNKPKTTTAAIPADTNDLRKLKISLGLIIVTFAFLLYAQSIPYNYTLDDHPVIDENTITIKGIAGIPTLLITDYWYGCKEKKGGPIYRPASVIMFAFVWQFFGNSPQIYHFMNVLLYAITCFVLFLLLCKLFKKYNLLFPFVCSLLYAAHPIHTEVVNNIKSADEVLCFLFGILSVYFVVKSVSNRFLFNIIVADLFFFLSLLSKESGTSFLLILPLTLFVFTTTTFRNHLVIFSQFLIISIVYFFIRFEVLKSIPDANNISYLANSLLTAPSFISRETTAFFIQLKYLFLLIFPYSLTCDYNFSMIKIHPISDPLAIIGILFYLGIGVYSLLNIFKKSIIAYGILFYLVMLAPVSNMFILIGATMAERFLYTPSLGFCIVLSYFLIKLTKSEILKNKFKNHSQFFSQNSKLFMILSVIIVLYSIKTISRNTVWKDNFTVFCHDAEVSENSTTVHYMLGLEYMKMFPRQNDKIEQDALLDKAISEFTKSISIYDHYTEAFLNLADAYKYKKDYQNAIKTYESALTIIDKPYPFLFNKLSGLYLDTKQVDKALAFSDSTIKYDENFTNAYNNKGSALMRLKRYQEAIIAFQKCVDLNPKFQVAYNNMGACYANLNQNQDALKAFIMAVSIDSTDVLSNKYLGIGYQNIGD